MAQITLNQLLDQKAIIADQITVANLMNDHMMEGKTIPSDMMDLFMSKKQLETAKKLLIHIDSAIDTMVKAHTCD